MLVTMQDVVNEVNKMNRVLSHPLWLAPDGDLSSQVIACTRILDGGFCPQTHPKIK